MRKGALYVEIDRFAAQWLRELIAWGLIADGDVYEGSFEDLTPAECDRYAQVHLCAGIGVWSYALRQAGWTDDRPVWTASFPCQPFSAAGKGGGFADERHLWPTGHFLIDQCRPVTLFGEQVASRPGLEWFDLVHADLEGSGYAVGAHDLCAAGVGAPHIRQRLYFVAISDGRDAGAERQQRSREHGQQQANGGTGQGALVDAESQQAGLPRRTREPGGSAGGVQHAESDRRLEWRTEPERRRAAGEGREAPGTDARSGPSEFQRDSGRQLDNAISQGLAGRQRSDDRERSSSEGRLPSPGNGGLHSYWGDVEWIPCRDGKWRPTQPGIFPLVNGATGRVGALRGYGNAIVAPVAEAFIRAAMTCL